MLEPGRGLHQSTQLMQPIEYVDLRSFDLNLLIAFDALMEERSVTRAAEHGSRVRQPAMSRVFLFCECFCRTSFSSEERRRLCGRPPER